MRSRRLEANGEAGMTLAELMISISLMGLLLAATLTFLTSASRTIAKSTKQQQSIDDARVTLARLENELRVAALIQQTSSCPSTATCLAITVPLTAGGTQGIRYRYDSGTKKLFRAKGDALTDTWGSEVPVVSNVVNGSQAVFCRSSACTTPSDVGATSIVLMVNADTTAGANPVKLSSYVSPRNG